MSTPVQTPLPECGTLADVAVPKLLVGLYRARSSTTLVLRRERTEKRILFHEGAPVAVESNLASESLAAQLVEAGRISAQQRTQVEARVERKGCKEAAALLSLQLLTPKQLFREIVDHLRRRVVDCFGWPDGAFERHDDQAPGADMQAFRADPYALVVEGMGAHWTPDRILQDLTPVLDRFPVPTPSFETATRRLSGDAAVDSLLAAIDGKQSLGQALATCFGSPRALATAWLLDAARLVELREHPESDEPIETEIEISVVETAAASSGRPEAAAGPARKDSAASLAEADRMRAEVEEKCQQLDTLDYYELLGVESNDSAAAIKKAYFAAAKRYHPDALARLDLGDWKEQAGKVFSRIARAYEVLSDASKRADYDAELSGEVPEIDAATLAQAETFFRKGEILVGMGDFRGAIEYLAPAVELWPEECEYQSALGWCFYKKSPPEPEPASRHLTEAVRLAPDSAVAHFRLGMVLRALGDAKAADEHLARAKSLDPKVS